jgi:glycine dehydrogenase subunit 1
MTAYTPYQAEASQGGLQLIYEYQTMMASLMGLDVSNASLYEGASALAEAILMTVRDKRGKAKRVLMPATVHPHYRRVAETLLSRQDVQIDTVPFDERSGRVTLKELDVFNGDDIAALVIPQPNFFGVLEDVDSLTNWAHEKNLLVIGVVNPIAMALLKPPGQWGEKGADIACGEGQPLGIPLSSGGAYFGFMCAKQKLVRQLPGRIVGRTHDTKGREGFVLTLQAREQHIRRGKARSNICTNQGLMVTAATIHMSLLGPQGLLRVAKSCHVNTEFLKAELQKVDGIELVFSGTTFHEVVVRLKRPVLEILEKLEKLSIQAGFSLKSDYPALGECLSICVTETKTHDDIALLVSKMSEAL